MTKTTRFKTKSPKDKGEYKVIDKNIIPKVS